MRLVLPYVDTMRPLETRILRLAEFLGIPCEGLALTKTSGPAKFPNETPRDRCSCFVLSPQVMQEWVGETGVSDELVAFLSARFSHILVHGLRLDPFDAEMVAVLSKGRLRSVDAIDRGCSAYAIANDSKDVAEAFSGLSFGPANPDNDHVMSFSASAPGVRQLISICGRPFMASVRLEGTEVMFVASEDVADLDSEVGDAPMADYFSRLLPHAMALRYAAGDECWRPYKAYASIIVDDPLLRRSYGFLNFDVLLQLAKEHSFHTTIAFIPHNFRRNSSRVIRMFQENPAHLSICFHGNDHTEGEFASTDSTLLNSLLFVAEDRMRLHHQLTGLSCDKVMVFPQGNFSIEAMKVLKSHNFYAAVNTVPYPVEQPLRLTIGELAQPAVLRYAGFPVFIRRPIRKTLSQDIAFNLFFGRPVLIVEHHEIFQRPESLVEIATRINSLASEVHWSGLAAVVSNSILTRRAPDDTYHVRAYSGTTRISNDSTSIRRYSIKWGDSCDSALNEQMVSDGTASCTAEAYDPGIGLSVELDPGSSQTFSLIHRNVHAEVRSLGLRWKAQAFLRRRLSEVRDNHLSKNQHLLRAATTLKERFLH